MQVGTSVSGNFPDYEKLIPTEFNHSARFDTVEAIKAVNTLKVLADSKTYPIDLTIASGKLIMANTEGKGEADINADTEGEGKIRIDGSYLAQALKACGGMVDFKLTNGYSPMLFAVDGYQLVVMPMVTSETSESQKRDREAKAQAEPTTTEQAEPVAEAEAEAEVEPSGEAEAEAKPKRSRKREKVAVA